MTSGPTEPDPATTGMPPGAESSSGGGVVDRPIEYDDCVGDTCEMPGDLCNQIDGHRWCGRPCYSGLECPVPDSGTAVPICSFGLGDGRCVLDCGYASVTCPEGMACEALGVGQGAAYRCMW